MSTCKVLSIAVTTSMVFLFQAQAQASSQVLGTWRMVKAQFEPDGRNVPAYGSSPNGLLVFTADMHFIEILTDADIPKFASDVRGQGTPEENRAATAGSIGFFGTYTLDDKGEFSGDRVEGSTFPNWVGDMRTRKDLQITIDGNRMAEHFRRPEGTEIAIT